MEDRKIIEDLLEDMQMLYRLPEPDNSLKYPQICQIDALRRFLKAIDENRSLKAEATSREAFISRLGVERLKLEAENAGYLSAQAELLKQRDKLQKQLTDLHKINEENAGAVVRYEEWWKLEKAALSIAGQKLIESGKKICDVSEANMGLLQRLRDAEASLSAMKKDRDKHFEAAAHYEAELFCANKKLSAKDKEIEGLNEKILYYQKCMKKQWEELSAIRGIGVNEWIEFEEKEHRKWLAQCGRLNNEKEYKNWFAIAIKKKLEA